ncbi:sulfotransferase family protein [Streptomyces sp. NRRL F-5126]|uniref:sulfotransferase family protein n=1 Tax=Streptomyces sp. NRRL F-5126 TaxID=1463857 RepID=UPI000692029F|nr:sulfotransferase family protein [Streptomyces sp. NRRL F-5126]
MVDVIGAGYGRTGTLSLRTALERLGFAPCYHMIEVLRDPDQLPRWSRALASDPVDIAGVLDGYRASVDFPTSMYWREQLAAWPDAKVVLTVRDPHRWYASAKETIFSMDRPDTDHPDPEIRELRRFMGQELMPRVMDVGADRPLNELDEEEAVAAFERHVADVRATVPPEQLLVFQVKEGWEPLCAFLGVPVPDEEFPRVNEASGFRQVAEAAFEERARALAARRA